MKIVKSKISNLSKGFFQWPLVFTGIITFFCAVYAQDISEAKKLLKQGRFMQTIEYLGEPKNAESYLIAGSAYYSLMLNNKYSTEDRVKYRRKAEEFLGRAYAVSSDREIRARALLLHAAVIHLNEISLKQKRVALGKLHRILTDSSLKKSASYDDAVLTTAIIYTRMGWYTQASAHFKKLAMLKSSDNSVYDPEINLVTTPKEASEIGMRRLNRIRRGIKD